MPLWGRISTHVGRVRRCWRFIDAFEATPGGRNFFFLFRADECRGTKHRFLERQPLRADGRLICQCGRTAATIQDGLVVLENV
jgi:hypothetical protein